MKIFKTAIIFVSIIFLQSCTEIDTVSQQSSTGGLNEILIVTNNLNQWEGEIGDSLRTNFSRTMQILPLEEPQFKMVNVNEASLGKQIFKNIIIFLL
jgi:hypothetical protein